MKKLIVILTLCVILCSCTNNKNNDSQSIIYNDLLRTGEFVTAEQIEILKEQALNWQAVQTGVGGFANIIVIDPPDGSNQQVFISVNYGFEDVVYERLQIQLPDETQACIIYAGSGGGSGEVVLGYKFLKDNIEWIELFFNSVFVFDGVKSEWSDILGSQWENVTELSIEMVQMLNEQPQNARQFK